MKKKKKKKVIGMNDFDTTTYIKPIRPDVNMTLNSRDFSVKGTAAIAGLGFAGYGGLQYIQHKECKRSFHVAVIFAVIFIGLECKDYLIDKKKEGKKASDDQPNGIDNDEDSTIEERSAKPRTVDNIRSKSTYQDYDEGQLVGKLIYKGDKAIVFSPNGVGKTVFMLTMIQDIALGRKPRVFPSDKSPSPQMVFYYDGESDSDDYKRIFGNHPIETDNLKVISGFFFKDIDSWITDVRKKIATTTGDCTIVLDNISCVASSFSAETIRQLFLGKLKAVQTENAGRKITFIVVAHTNKGDDLMGSINQNNFASTVIKLSDAGAGFLRLDIHKDRKYGEMKDKSFIIAKKQDVDGYQYDEYVEEIDTEKKESSAAVKPSSKADRIPYETKVAMKNWYQKGVNGRGLGSLIKKFNLGKYGIKDSTEVSRIIDSMPDDELE